MNRTRTIAATLALAALLPTAACNTIADAKAERGSGDARTYPFAFDDVWNASVDAVAGSNLNLVSKNEADGEILAQKSLSFASYGENVAIWVEPVATPDPPLDDATRVEIVSKRSVATNIFARNWAPDLHKTIAANLGMSADDAPPKAPDQAEAPQADDDRSDVG